MKLDLIKNYIKRLKKEDINDYLNKEHIEATNNEIDIIYNEIMSNYDNIDKINFEEYIIKFKDKLNTKLYNKIIEKYYEYKKFIE